MYLDCRVAVVIPAHNEAPYVRDVIESLPPLVDRAYVVDDASTDGTWAEIRAALRQAPSSRVFGPDSAGVPDGGALEGAGDDPAGPVADGDPADPVADGSRTGAAGGRLPAELPVNLPDGDEGPAVVAVRHPENRGRGGAVKTGYRLALADGMDVVAVMDGDGQMDPDRLDRIVHPVAAGLADYAKGDRLADPEHWQGMSRWRLLGNVLLTGLTRVSSGYWGLRDPQNGYTAISRSALAALPVEDLYDDYGFLNDVLVHLYAVDARVADVSLPAVYGDEESGIRYRQFVPAVSMLLLGNFLRRLYVDGARKGRVWLPAAYALAGASWVGALVGVASTATAGAGGTGSPLALGAAGLLTTALAVGLDRLRDAGHERHPGRRVDTR